MSKTGTPTGNIICKIEGASGTWSSSNLPNGTIYATSSNFDVSTLTTSLAIVNFTFPAGYIFDASQIYTLVFYNPASGTTSANYFNIGTDNANYLHGGNFAAYINGAWTADVTQDLTFNIFGDGGELVTFGQNGNVYITEVTEVTNVTSSPTVNVTTGDVNVGGVTAEFNNTTVDATGSSITAGDVSAGAVTAGDVVANGAVTFGGDLSVNGTFDNATLTYVTSTAVSGDANVYFLIAFIALAVLLTFYNKVPLMNFLVGIVGISFITLSFQNTDLPFWPYSSVLLALVSLLCMISGGFKMRNN